MIKTVQRTTVLLAALVAIVLALAVSPSFASDCAIKHCPKGTSCRPPAPDCPPLTTCPPIIPCLSCPECPAPQVALAPPEVRDRFILKTTYVTNEVLRNRLFFPITVIHVPGSSAEATYVETIEKPKDPGVSVNTGSRTGIGVGVGYDLSKHFALAAQVFQFSGGSTDVEWSHRPEKNLPRHLTRRVSPFTVDDSQDRTSFAATLIWRP